MTGSALGFNNAARYGLLIWVPVYLLGSDWKSDGSKIITVGPVALPVGGAGGAGQRPTLQLIFALAGLSHRVVVHGPGAVTAVVMHLASPILPEMG